MYCPSHFAEDRPERLQALMRAHPLATLLAGEEISHLPMLQQLDADGQMLLQGHVARANPLWQVLADGAEAVVLFHGPSAYVSPGWYPSKADHGRVVPTWNYAVVHARGRATAIEDRDWLLAHVEALTASHEAPPQWRPDDAPADFLDTLLRAIVGIELRVESLQGKFKLSQNRSEADRQGVLAGLEAHGETSMLHLMRELSPN